MIREILSTKGAFMPINEMKACHNIIQSEQSPEPTVGFIMRSLTQTCAIPLTVVVIKKHEPKGHFNVAISIKYGYQLSQISRATA